MIFQLFQRLRQGRVIFKVLHCRTRSINVLMFSMFNVLGGCRECAMFKSSLHCRTWSRNFSSLTGPKESATWRHWEYIDIHIGWWFLDVLWYSVFSETLINQSGQAGADDVKKHKWFKGVDWEDVYYRFRHQHHPYILLSQNTWSPQFHLIIPQKIEAATGAKVEIRGRHVQLRRLPWGRPEQGCRCQWKGAEDLWWLLITSSLGTVCGQTFFLWKHEDLPKWADITGACINVISIWPTSSQQIYFSSYSKCIFTSYANIFLNVLQIYFCKIFLSIICAAPQLKNLKYEQYKTWINDTSLV